jgi:hypothetical protein
MNSVKLLNMRQRARYGLALCLVVCATAASATVVRAQSVVRGPYLCMATQNSIVVRWRTDVATDSRVVFGYDPSDLAQSAAVDEVTMEHEVEIQGLDANTKYYYAIGSKDGVLVGSDYSYYFKTFPEAGVAKPTRVWIIGDSGKPGPGAEAVRDAYLDFPGSDDTDVWLMLGDNAYRVGSDEDYQGAVFEMYDTILRNTVVSPTRGNHDQLYEGPNNDYYDMFTLPMKGQAGGVASGSEAYYSFDYANVHFVCLDSEGTDRSVGSPMLTWLADDLAATDQEWIVAYFHHPPYTKGSHNSDNPADSGGRMKQMRENALPILEEGGVDLVLSGHSHSYERSFLLDGHHGVSDELEEAMIKDDGNGSVVGDGAYQKSAGLSSNEGAVYAVPGSSSKLSGGKLNHPVMVASMNVLGSMVLDISGNQLDAVFIDDTGVVRDEFSIIKGAADAEMNAPIAANSPRLSPDASAVVADATRLDFSLPVGGSVRLTIYDGAGNIVKTLVNDFRGAGDHFATWDRLSNDGQPVVGGTYFGVLQFGNEKRTRKLVLTN